MDLFGRTFLPAAIDAGLTMPAVLRHLDPVRRYLGGNDAVLLVSRCTRPRRWWSGGYLLALSRHRLVVLRRGPLRRAPRLHLEAAIPDLHDVRWAPEPGESRVLLAATAAGVRQKLLVRARSARAVWQLDAALGYVFHSADEAAAPVRPVPR